MTKHEQIKTMKLYHHLDRIERRLQLANKSNPTNKTNTADPNTNQQTNDPEIDAPAQSSKSPLDPELLGTLDGLHFFGDEPLQKIQRLIAARQRARGGAPGDVRVLDVGTGYGGSARLLAHRSGCRVDALELQPDLSAVAQQLTARCALDAQVTHLTGDFLLRAVTPQRYDVVVGLLCFLHIGHWRELFRRCLESLAPGGVLYVEDFFQKGAAFSEDEQRLLRDDVFCAPLATERELLDVLHEVGFVDVQWADATAKWTPYVAARATTFRAQLATHAQVDGADAAHALDHFYTAVADVFARGNLGGYMLTARRPEATNQSTNQ